MAVTLAKTDTVALAESFIEERARIGRENQAAPTTVEHSGPVG